MGTEELVQWDKVKGLARSKLDTLHAQRLALANQIKDLKEKQAKIDNRVLTILINAEVKSVAIGGTRCTFVAGGDSNKFDKKKAYTKLLELGVEAATVDKAYKVATKVTPGGRTAYVKWTEPGEGNGHEEEEE